MQGELVPGPLPLGVAVIDMSVSLFGQIFPRVANKHRLQMLDHFAECIRHAKSSRQEAVQMNVFTAVLSGLKGLTESKTTFGQEDVKKSAASLIIVSSEFPLSFSVLVLIENGDNFIKIYSHRNVFEGNVAQIRRQIICFHCVCVRACVHTCMLEGGRACLLFLWEDRKYIQLLVNQFKIIFVSK